MPRRIQLILILVLSCAANWSHAHHSRANFDLERIIGFQATVTRYQYTNPHSYVYAERRSGAGAVENWVIELGSIPNLRRMRMGADALQAGDLITIRGNPERDPDKKYLFLVSITRQDGKVYAMDDVFAAGRQVRERGATQPGSKDFSGKWSMDFARQTVLIGTGSVRPEYPVTAAGKASLAGFNPDADPFFNCVNPGIPRMIGSPYALVIERPDAGTILFKYEFPALQRVIRLGTDSDPESITPSTLGHSTGRFEGETLVIESSGFAPETWGIGPGLDSSEQKKTVERYTLDEEGRLLRLHLTVSDPVYLTAPFERDYAWRHVPDYEITEYVACDREAAAKHLELEHE
jgi:hypothetical protein